MSLPDVQSLKLQPAIQGVANKWWGEMTAFKNTYEGEQDPQLRAIYDSKIRSYASFLESLPKYVEVENAVNAKQRQGIDPIADRTQFAQMKEQVEKQKKTQEGSGGGPNWVLITIVIIIILVSIGVGVWYVMKYKQDFTSDPIVKSWFDYPTPDPMFYAIKDPSLTGPITNDYLQNRVFPSTYWGPNF